MSIAFEHAWVLWALPLALLALRAPPCPPLAYSSTTLIARDIASSVSDGVLRVVGASAIAVLLLCLSGPFRPAQQVERIGQGAQMVLLLDRSRSMDQPFYSKTDRFFYNTAALDSPNSKARLAHRVVSEFVARRENDMFGLILFSTFPIEVLPLTSKQAAMQAAIRAGNIGRGLAETDLGAGLEAAVRFFQNRRFVGSRMVMLISDGAAELDLDTRARLGSLMQRERVTLYWIYIRSRNSPGLFGPIAAAADTVAPQRTLHRYFSELGIPYRAYTAENPEDLEHAIADVERLQTLPIRHFVQVPKRDLTQWFVALAALLLGLLAGAKLIEVRTWR